jgi:BirA family transcriptional regulator, biotin operon repressor / biotin---[acetyl-CoA-carboxylase] ligase
MRFALTNRPLRAQYFTMQTRTAIAAALAAEAEWVSGEALARQLGISRAGVAKQIGVLRAAGYTIQAARRLGYRLASVPDKLLPERLAPLLKTTRLGRGVVIHTDSIASTNQEALRLAGEGCADGTLVLAETQTAGRGRRGRLWESPTGVGIYASLVLRPDLPLDRVPLLTLLTAVAAAEAIHAVTGEAPQIKWPNDLLLNGRKIAGVLIEVASEIDALDYAVIGLGINVNTPPAALPPRPIYPASSLLAELGHPVDRVELLAAWLNRMETWQGRLTTATGAARLLSRWRALAGTLGRLFTVHTGRATIRGHALDLDRDGALILVDRDGAHHRILSGDLA